MTTKDFFSKSKIPSISNPHNITKNREKCFPPPPGIFSQKNQFEAGGLVGRDGGNE